MNKLSEDEATDKLKELVARCKECKFASCENCEINWNEVKAIKTILDSYQHKKGRIDELKQELLQEKEKNNNLIKQLQEQNTEIQDISKQLREKEKEVVLVPEGTCFMMKPKNVVSKDKIRDMKRYREFELQQEYKEFKDDIEWKTYNKILEEE